MQITSFNSYNQSQKKQLGFGSVNIEEIASKIKKDGGVLIKYLNEFTGKDEVMFANRGPIYENAKWSGCLQEQYRFTGSNIDENGSEGLGWREAKDWFKNKPEGRIADNITIIDLEEAKKIAAAKMREIRAMIASNTPKF